MSTSAALLELHPIAKMAPAVTYEKGSKATAGPVRKKLKASDLPLTSATRNAIDGLTHTYKKKGGYDSLRQEVWNELERSVSLQYPFTFRV